MTVCRFFQQGYCRFGAGCRFEHNDPYKYTNYGNSGSRQQQTQQQHQQQQYSAPNATHQSDSASTEQLINQVVADTSAALNGRQWPLSCYSPFKTKPNFPGLEDVSPEEVRWQMTQARANGTFDQTVGQIARLQSEALEKFKALTKPNRTIVDAIERLYRNETPSDPFRTGPNGFGQNANPFGSAFGGGTASSDGAASQLFANAAKTIFQNAPMTGDAFQMDSASAFGGFNQRPAQTFPGGGFPPNPPANGGIFGNAGGFGSPNPAAVTPADLFANANKSLERSAPTPNDVFGRPSNPSANGNPFETNANVGPFGASANAGPFGTNPVNPFGTNADANPFAVSTPFGASNPNPFGAANIFNGREANTEGIYSKLEDLTEEEVTSYRSETFYRDTIPENPPPLELCH